MAALNNLWPPTLRDVLEILVVIGLGFWEALACACQLHALCPCGCLLLNWQPPYGLKGSKSSGMRAV
eukprot:9114657-Lingulodinium_polyedra.AAC.1